MMENYTTLEEELIQVFKKRGLKVKTLTVAVGATKYTIHLERGKKK